MIWSISYNSSVGLKGINSYQSPTVCLSLLIMNISANTAWLWSRIFFSSFYLTSNVHSNRNNAGFNWRFNLRVLWYEFNWKSPPLCYSPRNITCVYLPRNTLLMFMFPPRLILMFQRCCHHYVDTTHVLLYASAAAQPVQNGAYLVRYTMQSE